MQKYIDFRLIQQKMLKNAIFFDFFKNAWLVNYERFTVLLMTIYNKKNRKRLVIKLMIVYLYFNIKKDEGIIWQFSSDFM